MFDYATHEKTPPAPGDLELLQGFVNLHGHDAEGRSFEPTTQMIGSFLVRRGLLREDERLTEADRETYFDLRRAIRNLIDADLGEPTSAEDASALDRTGVAG